LFVFEFDPYVVPAQTVVVVATVVVVSGAEAEAGGMVALLPAMVIGLARRAAPTSSPQRARCVCAVLFCACRADESELPWRATDSPELPRHGGPLFTSNSVEFQSFVSPIGQTLTMF